MRIVSASGESFDQPGGKIRIVHSPQKVIQMKPTQYGNQGNLFESIPFLRKQPIIWFSVVVAAQPQQTERPRVVIRPSIAPKAEQQPAQKNVTYVRLQNQGGNVSLGGSGGKTQMITLRSGGASSGTTPILPRATSTSASSSGSNVVRISLPASAVASLPKVQKAQRIILPSTTETIKLGPPAPSPAPAATSTPTVQAPKRVC